MPLAWPIVRFFAQVKDAKGEDFHSVSEADVWPKACPREVGVPFSYFGIYDGHGGPEAGEYCKKCMLVNITNAMDELVGDDGGDLLTNWTKHLPKVIESFTIGIFADFLLFFL
jgi:serine/threonine protein phosphatase PrpC